MAEKKIFPDRVDIAIGDALKDVATGNFSGITKAIKFDVSLPLGRAVGGVSRFYRRVSGNEHESVAKADQSLSDAREKVSALFIAAQPVLKEMQVRGIADANTDRALVLVTDGRETGPLKLGRVGRNEYRELYFSTNSTLLSERAVDLRKDPIWANKLIAVEASASLALSAIEQAKDDEFTVARLGLTDRLNRTLDRADSNSAEVNDLERTFQLVSNLVPSSQQADSQMNEGEAAQFCRHTAYTTALNEHVKKLMAPQMSLKNTGTELANHVGGWKENHSETIILPANKPK